MIGDADVCGITVIVVTTAESTARAESREYSNSISSISSSSYISVMYQ